MVVVYAYPNVSYRFQFGEEISGRNLIAVEVDVENIRVNFFSRRYFDIRMIHVPDGCERKHFIGTISDVSIGGGGIPADKSS